MKKIYSIVLFVIFLSCFSVKGQDFHLIYLRQDISMDNDSIVATLSQLADQYPNRVLYFSNDGIIMDAKTWKEKDLRSAIFTRGSLQPMSTSVELNLLSSLLEKYLRLEFVGNQIVTKKYKKVIFDFIVGDDFVENGYQDFLIAKLLYYNSLNLGNIPIDINYYRCGATYQKVTISSQYTINENSQNIK